MPYRFRTINEPFRIHSVEPLRMTTEAQRRERIPIITLHYRRCPGHGNDDAAQAASDDERKEIAAAQFQLST